VEQREDVGLRAGFDSAQPAGLARSPAKIFSQFVMPLALPAITPEQFAAEIAALTPSPLLSLAIDRLYAHYQELARWSARLNLIGPGTVAEILTRHYGESLAALPLLPDGPATVVDLGSGAGFPGLVVAAARPDLDVYLLEARERKWAFLESAARRASLPCHCLNARVRLPLPIGLPENIDLITSRALRLDPALLAGLTARLSHRGSFLLWVGSEEPELPPALGRGRSLALGAASTRRIVELFPLGNRGAR
jgi:16S rRNA (guanine527-N7)-methyltransferase